MGPPIVLAAAPIGNDRDASAHLHDELEKADVAVAEDIRHLLSLAGRLGIVVRGRVLSFHEYNEADRAPVLLGLAREGKRIVVVNNAGMPSVSDPGYRLVALTACSGVDVEAVPGPPVVLTALAVSGLTIGRFYLGGFLPRKAGELATTIRGLKSEGRMMVSSESPRCLGAALRVMYGGFGSDRPACVCRESTRIHQEIAWGSLGELAERFSREVLGEIVVVVADVPRREADVEASVAEILALANAGPWLKDTAAHVIRRVGLRKKDLYDTMAAARAV